MTKRAPYSLAMILLIVSRGLAGTEVDSMLQRLKILRSSAIRDKEHVLSEVGKCGFGVAVSAVAMWQLLTPDQKAVAKTLMAPLQFQKDTVIGRFRVHYDTTNVNGNEPALLDPTGTRIPGTARAYVD